MKRSTRRKINDYLRKAIEYLEDSPRPDEIFMRGEVEEKIGITDSVKLDFRREVVMEYGRLRYRRLPLEKSELFKNIEAAFEEEEIPFG